MRYKHEVELQRWAQRGGGDGTLTLNFGDDLTSIEAGKPYIVKWSAGSNIEKPVFTNVTISETNATVETDYMDFIGTYSPVVIYEEGEEKLRWRQRL